MEQPSIKAIDKISVARICSGQVITDLSTAVKELVENSLDAGAKHVEVKLKDFGLDLIEVSDNGSGVSPSNYEGLALKYHTSKLSLFSDLSAVKSFGFRGEALSSLCELADSFSVTTRTAVQSVGVRLTYGRNGKLLTKETAPRRVGTTMSVSNMFKPLPVRRGEFRRNIKKQYTRLLRIMQAYALISTGARITVTNTKAKGNKQILIGTQYNNKLEDNVTNIFGAKFLSTLTSIQVCLMEEGDTDKQGQLNYENEKATDDARGKNRSPMPDVKKDERKIWGMVSRAGEGVGRADNDRQFVYTNGRPVDLPKLTRAVNEVWRAYEMKQKPAFILDVRLPPGSLDVNVTPDKREIFMTGEEEILESLKKALHEHWAPSCYTMPLNQGQLVQARLTDGALVAPQQPRRTHFSPTPTSADAACTRDIVSPGLHVNLCALEVTSAEKRGTDVTRESRSLVTGCSADIDERVKVDGEHQERIITRLSDGGAHDRDYVESASAKAKEVNANNSSAAVVPGDASSQSTTLEGEGEASDHSASPKLRHLNDGRVNEEIRPAASAGDVAPRGRGKRTRVRVDDAEGERGETSQGRGQGRDNTEKVEKGSPRGSKAASDVDTTDSPPIGESVRANGIPDVPLAFDLSSVLEGCRKASRLKRQRDARNASARSFSGKLSGTASAEDQDSKAAARAFSRILCKEHFTQMRVVGQFNMGFMICILGADLFILDQHACDEKYNFEVLQKTTTIHQQPLVRPLRLETSAPEEMTIMDNMSVFEKNGFRFEVDDQQPATKKLKVTAVPFSKGTQFGVDDVHELASIVADSNSGEMVRLPKARAMFATRACRSSIMIGRSLDKGQMARVVAKMATIEQPWNCPHGRPTMRHLADVSKSLRSIAALDALLEE